MNNRQQAALQHALRILPHLGTFNHPLPKNLDSLVSERIVVCGMVLVKRLFFVLRHNQPSIWIGEVTGFEQPPDDEMLKACLDYHLLPLFEGIGMPGRVLYVDGRRRGTPIEGAALDVTSGITGMLIADSHRIWSTRVAHPREWQQALEGKWPSDAEQALYAERTGMSFADMVRDSRADLAEIKQLANDEEAYISLLQVAREASMQPAAVPAVEQYKHQLAYHPIHLAWQPENGKYKGLVCITGYHQPEESPENKPSRMVVTLSTTTDSQAIVWEIWRAPNESRLDFMTRAFVYAEAICQTFPGVGYMALSQSNELEPCECGQCPSGYRVIAFTEIEFNQ